MTVAQLVHPAQRLARGTRRKVHHWPYSLARRRRRDAALWRAIGIGFALGLVSVVIMALAVGAAGSAPAVTPSVAAAQVGTHAIPDRRLEIYQMPWAAMNEAMPVP